MPDLVVANTISLGERALILSGIGAGNIWIEEDFQDSSLLLAREAILKLLLGTASGQLEIVVFDYNLRGVAAPFSELQNVGLLHTLISERDAADYFEFLKTHVQGVNGVIQGRCKDLVAFRKLLGQEIEGYKLVVIAADLLLLDDKVKESLSILLSAGPAAGVSFLIISPADAELGFLKDRCQFVKSNMAASILGVESILSSCHNLVAQTLKASIDPVDFEDIQSFDRMWTEDSTDGITFSIGKYGAEVFEITLGNNREQRHNALITGAVGQGKSNVIAVLIHSLCQRYSPDELELYLLDFKEGVTLQAYANIGQESWLVHARALGLESDTSFGIAVLEHLYAVYEKRMALFKEYGVQGLKDYRELTGRPLPRILLVIDEFQVLLEERDDEKKAASLLSKCARLFRAAGIHIILASQTIANGLELNKDADLFSQTPIRIALKNSARESEATLELGNIAATDLRMGQAIVNLDYGAVASNRKVSVAYANPEQLSMLRSRWWEARSHTSTPPYVFNGKTPARIEHFLPELMELRSQKRDIPEILLGKTISVDGHPLFVRLPREPGRNVALIGAGARSADYNSQNADINNIAIGLIQSAAISIALQNTKGNAQFVMCDLSDDSQEHQSHMKLFISLIRELGFIIEVLDREAFSLRVDELAESLTTRTAEDDAVFVLGFALDRLGARVSGIEELCRNGSSNGVHMLGWWQKLDRFEDQIGFGNASYFDVKVMLRVDARDVQHCLGLYETWKNEDNRALVSDITYLASPLHVIPMSPVTSEDVNKTNSAVM